MSFSGVPALAFRQIGLMTAILSVLLTGACIDDFLPDPLDYPSLDGIIVPDGMGFDIPDVSPDSDEGEEKCARNCYDRVCGPDGCEGTCGTCPSGTVCSLDYSICLAESALLPDGSSCGRNAACAPELEDPFNPGEHYDNPDWPRCLNHQCRGLLCESGVCTRPCVVRKDSVVNGTGISGADGIEDNTADSDCVLAIGTLYQGETMCVGRANNAEGQLTGVCLPASSFMPCNPSDNCQGAEACSYVRVGAKIDRRCLASVQGGAGYAGPCGFDSVSGDNVVCESGLCSGNGCTKPCDVDTECLVEGSGCDRGLCAGSGRPCAGDADCSSWVCGSSVVLFDSLTSACEPRVCAGDLDCPGDGFYCAPSFGYDDMGQTVASGWCARVVPGGSPVGAPCGGNDGGAVTVCRNRDLCIDGFCSARCGNDFDCFIHGDQRCALTQELFSSGYIAVDLWIDVGYCMPTGYRREGCHSDEECGDRVCTPWVSDARGFREVVTTCMDPPVDGWPLGTACGELAWDAACRSRFCFGEDIVNARPGWCSKTCASDADCPESAAWGSGLYRWICSGMPIIGGDSQRVDDDLFASWCVPVSPAGTYDDCGSTRFCAQADQVCTPILRAGPGIGEEKVDYRCLAALDGAEPGSICNPFGDGTDCSTGICVPSATSDVGFCSFTCRSDVDCVAFGEKVTCQSVHQGISIAGQPLAADICRMTGECLVCAGDTDCPDACRCVNITGSYWWDDMRCVRECEDNADCADITGMECLDVSAVFSASALPVRVCMTPACS